MRHGGFVTLFLIIAAISILLDLYISSGLKTLMRDCSSQKLRAIALWAYWIISLTIIVSLIASFSSFTTARGMMPFHEWILSFFLIFFITKLVFAIVLSLGDLGRFVAGIAQNLRGTKKTVPYFPERRKFISEIAVLVAAVPFTSLLYAMVGGKYNYKVHRTTLYFDDLPDAFDGFTITQISDIHSGSFDNTDAVQKGINLAKGQKSDLFVFTGDLVNNVAWEIEPYLDRFKELKAPFGQFSILGNHDYGDYIHWNSEEEKAANLEKLKQHHKELGFRLLLDENLEIEKDGQKITVIGVQNWGRGFVKVGNLDKALIGAPKDSFKILLSHDPTHWEEKVRHHPTHIHLTLSGHTHGAQFGVETAGMRWSPVQYRYLDWAGLFVENQKHLYVNRGFGFLAFSGRLGIWPEITVLELRKKA